MKQSKKIVFSIIIGVTCIIIAIFLIKSYLYKPLEISEIYTNNTVFQLTNRKSDYLQFSKIEEFKVFDNSRDFEIEIKNPDIITYKNLRVGDSIDKLDFCKQVGGVYYFETDYRYNGYHMEIIYGGGFDDTILSITYRFFSK